MRTKFVLLMAVYFIFNGAAPAAADSMGLPIRATIIQCGPRADLKLSCEKDDRCCVFLDLVPMTAADTEQAEPQPMPAPQNSDIIIAGAGADGLLRSPFPAR